MWVLAFLFALLALIFIAAAASGAEDNEELPWLWGMAALALFGIRFAIGLARLQIWLLGDRLVKQGPFFRTSFPLSRVRFSMTVMKWHYTAQLVNGAVRTVEVESPALVFRASWWQRAKVPLVSRAGHEVLGDRVAVLWLPLEVRELLAAAIETYATDRRKDRVARFLRHVERSPIRPQGEAASPSL
jgi:hypothetical protein